MRPLRVRIDVTDGTATPAQPDPQTIHLNAAQRQQPQKRLPAPTTSPPPQRQPLRENPASGASLLTEGTAEPSSPQPQRQKNPLAGGKSSTLPSPEIPPPATAGNLPNAPASHAPPNLANPHTASCARLLHKADIPPETARLVRCHNPWLTEDVLFCPDGALPAFVTGIPALSSGPELWYAMHNHRPEPFSFTQGRVLASLRWSTSRKHPPLPHPPHILPVLASHRFQSASRRSSSSSSTSCSGSIRTSSARVKTT